MARTITLRMFRLEPDAAPPAMPTMPLLDGGPVQLRRQPRLPRPSGAPRHRDLVASLPLRRYATKAADPRPTTSSLRYQRLLTALEDARREAKERARIHLETGELEPAPPPTPAEIEAAQSCAAEPPTAAQETATSDGADPTAEIVLRRGTDPVWLLAAGGGLALASAALVLLVLLVLGALRSERPAVRPQARAVAHEPQPVVVTHRPPARPAPPAAINSGTDELEPGLAGRAPEPIKHARRTSVAPGSRTRGARARRAWRRNNLLLAAGHVVDPDALLAAGRQPRRLRDRHGLALPGWMR